MGALLGFFDFICLLSILISVGWGVVRLIRRESIKSPIKSFVLSVVLLIIITYTAVTFFPNDSEVDNVKVETNEAEEMSFVESSTVNEETEENESIQEDYSKVNVLDLEEMSTTEFSSSEDVELESEIDSSEEVAESEISSSDDTEELDLDDDTDIEKNEIESEEEYKAKCITLYHDDVFFSETDLEGTAVRLELFVEEEYFFKLEAAFDYSFRKFNDKYDLKRCFFKCGVKRDVDSVSYVGGQLNLYFSNNYELQSTDIMLGDHVVVYGEVVVFSTNTTSGYNSVSIIPHYIENNGQ